MEIKRAFGIHLGATLLVALIALELGGPQQAVSAALGSVVIAMSVGFMAWSIERIFAKKSVALASGVIVIKWVILGVVLYWMTLQPWIHLLWVGVGVSSVLITAVFYGLTTTDLTEREQP